MKKHEAKRAILIPTVIRELGEAIGDLSRLYDPDFEDERALVDEYSDVETLENILDRVKGYLENAGQPQTAFLYLRDAQDFLNVAVWLLSMANGHAFNEAQLGWIKEATIHADRTEESIMAAIEAGGH